MKDTDKITMTVGQLKRFINEAKISKRLKFKVGDYIVNKKDPKEIYYISKIYSEDDPENCSYAADVVKQVLKRTGSSIDLWVKKGHNGPYESQFELLNKENL